MGTPRHRGEGGSPHEVTDKHEPERGCVRSDDDDQGPAIDGGDARTIEWRTAPPPTRRAAQRVAPAVEDCPRS